MLHYTSSYYTISKFVSWHFRFEGNYITINATHSTIPVSICSGWGSTTVIVAVDGGGGGNSVGPIVTGSVGTKINKNGVNK